MTRPIKREDVGNAPPTRLLLVDDAAAHCRPPLATALRPLGFELTEETQARQAYNAVRRDKPDVVLLDLHFPGDERRKDGLTSGAEQLNVLRESFPALAVVLFTTRLLDNQIPLNNFPLQPHGRFGKHQINEDPNWAVSLADRLRQAIRGAAGRPWPPPDDLAFSVESEGVMRPFVDRLYQAAEQCLDAVIVGEDGVGKLRAARAIHRLTDGLGGAPIELLCETLSPDAVSQAAARSAKTSVILVGLEHLSPPAQLELAAWLKASRRAPSPDLAPLRFIATSSAKPSDLESRGRLRSDVALALGAGAEVLMMPPLRERLDDLPALFGEIVPQAARRAGRYMTPTPHSDVLEVLRAHAWPGNIPELTAVLTKAVVRTTSNVLMPEDIEFAVRPSQLLEELGTGRLRSSGPEVGDGTPAEVTAIVSQVMAIAPVTDARFRHIRDNLGAELRIKVLNKLARALGRDDKPATWRQVAEFLAPNMDTDTYHNRIRSLVRKKGI